MTQISTCGHIRPAEWPADQAIVTKLLRDYADFLVHNPAGSVDICLEGYERELATLAERYSEPNGALLLLFVEDKPAGCVAIKIRHDRPGSCEMKRLWIDPAYRGKTFGKILIEAAISWCERRGADVLLLDTVPAAMPAAVALYRSLGFVETARHNDNPVDGLIFFELSLR